MSQDTRRALREITMSADTATAIDEIALYLVDEDMIVEESEVES